MFVDKDYHPFEIDINVNIQSWNKRLLYWIFLGVENVHPFSNKMNRPVHKIVNPNIDV